MNAAAVATANWWDAPIIVEHTDSGVTLRREWAMPPGAPRSVTVIPHGVIVVDGAISNFDRARQPTSPLPFATAHPDTLEELIADPGAWPDLAPAWKHLTGGPP